LLQKKAVKNHSWVLVGNFNATLDPCEHSVGASVVTDSIGRTDGLLKKLDRVMGNSEFMAEFPNANAVFLPFYKSDHSPVVVRFPELLKAKPRPFKFHNLPKGKCPFIQKKEKDKEYRTN